MAELPPVTSTLVLLLSGAAVTWAHQALAAGRRRAFLGALAAAILLGIGFLALQTVAFAQAPFMVEAWRQPPGPDLLQPAPQPLALHPVVLFMWTGYHGYLVLFGLALMAAALIFAAVLRQAPGRSIALESVAWYWHGVDLVWLILFAGLVMASVGAPALRL